MPTIQQLLRDADKLASELVKTKHTPDDEHSATVQTGTYAEQMSGIITTMEVEEKGSETVFDLTQVNTGEATLASEPDKFERFILVYTHGGDYALMTSGLFPVETSAITRLDEYDGKGTEHATINAETADKMLRPATTEEIERFVELVRTGLRGECYDITAISDADIHYYTERWRRELYPNHPEGKGSIMVSVLGTIRTALKRLIDTI